MSAETITITKEEHEHLIEAAAKLNALEVNGVDNWEGYDYAMEWKRLNV